MKVRRLAFWLFLFIAVDFGTPFIGGAFTFEAETSAEALRFQRERALAPSQPALTLPPVGAESERISRPVPEETERSSGSARRWVTALPRARVLADSPSSPSDGH